eukprot:g11405.t1
MDMYKKQNSNLLTWDELWSLFEYSPYLMDNLIPGMHQLNWVLTDDIVNNKSVGGTGSKVDPKPDLSTSGAATTRPGGLSKTQSEAHLWTAGVKHGYCAALRGEWRYVPRTLTQIDSQEYLLWNPTTAERPEALRVFSAGSAAAPPDGEAAEPALKTRSAKLRQSVSETMLDQKQGVPKVSSKTWGREALLRFNLYSLAKAKKKVGEADLREDGADKKQALENAVASVF